MIVFGFDDAELVKGTEPVFDKSLGVTLRCSDCVWRFSRGISPTTVESWLASFTILSNEDSLGLPWWRYLAGSAVVVDATDDVVVVSVVAGLMF